MLPDHILLPRDDSPEDGIGDVQIQTTKTYEDLAHQLVDMIIKNPGIISDVRRKTTVAYDPAQDPMQPEQFIGITGP
jgi:hypothetical protein